jgi:flagellar biosynthetic protein FliR
MLSVTSAQLDAWLALLAFPLARILGLIGAAPVFGNNGLPRRIKLVVGLAVGIGLPRPFRPTRRFPRTPGPGS